MERSYPDADANHMKICPSGLPSYAHNLAGQYTYILCPGCTGLGDHLPETWT